MIGYIRPYAPDLRIREYRYYRGVYCGLCHAMGRLTGQTSRLTLSYDLTFLALVRLALTEDEQMPVRFEKRRCVLHPLRRHLALAPHAATDYTACAAAILNDYKIRDDISDERGGRRAAASLFSPSLRRFSRRAERKCPGLSATVAERMAELNRIEEEKTSSADRPAAAFGEVFATLFSFGLAGERETIARHVGFHVGKWLYLIDAIDDYDADLKKERFNPLLILYGGEGFTRENREDLLTALNMELKCAADAMDLHAPDPAIFGTELGALLEHFLRVALPRKTNEILFPPEEKRPRKKKGRDEYDGSL